MKFALRDDDTNFFTKPEELERIYAGIWDDIPISLAVVPCQRSMKIRSIPQKYWKGNSKFPIGENTSLVNFLRKQIKKRRVSIMLHGYSHRDYKNGFEFEKGHGLYDKVKEGKEYLEELFDVKVKTFVPPHNSLSIEGTRAVVQNGLNIVGAFGHRPWERIPGVVNVINFLKLFSFMLKYGREKRYPYVLDFDNHKEFGCYSLIGSTHFEDLFARLRFAEKKKGDFCVATHYWEVLAADLKPTLMQLIREAQTIEGIQFVTVDQLWE